MNASGNAESRPRPTAKIPHTFSCAVGAAPAGRWLNLAFAFCLVFGIVLISQVQVAGDGMWFWYAVALNHGSHLYRDLHLPLQPLYPLIVAGTLKVFGTNWLLGRLVPCGLMALYALAMRMVARYFPGTDMQRGIAMLYGFSAPLLFGASRFDDYHVLTDAAAAFSIVLLLKVMCVEQEPRSASTRKVLRYSAKVLRYSALLGLCCGLAIVSRLNDGAFLALSVFLVLAAAAKGCRLKSLGVFAVVSALVALAAILLTGDTLREWAAETIFHASSAKGGAGKVLIAPLRLVPVMANEWLHQPHNFLVLFAVIALGLCLAAALRQKGSRKPLLALAAGLCLALLWMSLRWGIASVPQCLDGVAVPAAFVFSAVGLYASLRSMPRVEAAAPMLLVLVPFGQFLSGAMSSSGYYDPLTSPLGMFLLVMPIAFAGLFASATRRTVYASVLGVAALFSFAFKVQHPFWWHNYVSRPLFVGRQVYRHPVYGPMIIERNLLQLALPMCEAARSMPGQDMLSLPFPFPNYFCDVPPWHGYVQTFFDLSTRQTIDRILKDLATQPPGTVVYQRQIKVLEMHEFIYTHGKPLPQRDLDEFIGQKVDSGTWTIAREQCLGRNDWITLRTIPAERPPARPFQASRYQCEK